MKLVMKLTLDEVASLLVDALMQHGHDVLPDEIEITDDEGQHELTLSIPTKRITPQRVTK